MSTGWAFFWFFADLPGVHARAARGRFWPRGSRRQGEQGPVYPAPRASDTGLNGRCPRAGLRCVDRAPWADHSPGPDQHVTGARNVPRRLRDRPLLPLPRRPLVVGEAACLGPSRASTASTPSERCGLRLGARTWARESAGVRREAPRRHLFASVSPLRRRPARKHPARATARASTTLPYLEQRPRKSAKNLFLSSAGHGGCRSNGNRTPVRFPRKRIP